MTTAPATDRQVAFLTRLATERGLDAPDPATLTKRDASRLIESLMSTPRPAPTREVAVTDRLADLGYYVVDGVVTVVVDNRAGTRRYAKRLEFDGGRPRWAYAPGLVASLVDAPRLTLADASKLGHLHGVCVICTKTLTDPASVEAGIGPVCAKRL